MRSLLSMIFMVLLVFGCGARATRPARPGEPGALSPGPILAVSALDYDFQWRQRVTIEWGEDESESFDAVLQKRDGALLLLGLTPMGTPAFTLTLSNGEVSFENRTDRELPFPPEYILADVQHVFFPWSSGEHDILLVSERREGDRLVERVFRRTDAPDRGAVTIRYGDVPEGGDAPDRAILESEWFGYRLTVVTVAQQRL